jgi:putative tricarboxylic transport membrane protein
MIGFAVFYLCLTTEFPIGLAEGVPGAGMLPFILGVTLLLLSALYLLRSWKQKVPREGKFWSGDIPSLSLCLIFYLGYVISIKWLGFILSTFLFGLITLRFLFKRKWLTSLLCSITFTIIFQIAFYNLLGVPLPRGLSWKFLSAIGLVSGG